MDWIPLVSVEQVQEIKQHSHQQACFLFKHSSRCDLSAIAQLRLESDWSYPSHEITTYFLDIIQYPAVSKAVADVFSEYHESPQVLLIEGGECTYVADHLEISVEDFASCYPTS